MAGKTGRRPRIAFVFTGQGSQYPGMALALWERYEVFRDTWRQADDCLRELSEPGLSERVFGESASETTLAQTGLAQLALYVLQVGLLRVLQQCGVRPSHVLGHSVGEFAAAVAAGVFGFEDGLRLVAHRARLMQACEAGGAMLAVQHDRPGLTALLSRLGVDAVIAVINGPKQLVLAGSSVALDVVEAALSEIGAPCRRLQVSHAFHSEAMKPAAQALADVAAALPHQAPTLPFISSMTATPIQSGQAWSTYWPAQILAPVEFERAAHCLMDAKPDLVIELGPRATLCALLAPQFPEAQLACPVDPSGRDHSALLRVLGRCFEAGLDLDPLAVHGASRKARPRLPGYPFARQLHALYPPVNGFQRPLKLAALCA